MADPRTRRLAALSDAVSAAGLDGLLVSGLANIQYLTGFAGSSALVLAMPRETVLITDFRYQTQVAEEVGDLARIVIEPLSLWTGLWQQLVGMPGVKVVGFEAAHMMHRDFQRLLDAGGRWQWRPATDMVERLRERKDEDELDRIQRAADAAVSALTRTLPQVHAGMTELEVAGVLEHALRDEGSEGFPFASIVAAGARAALPHARPTSHRVAAGDFLLIDFGAVVDGYCSDVTRTVVVGRATAEQREVYDVVREANQAASTAVRAGMTGRDADRVARSYIERHGMGDLFGHSLGHGIGLEVHEAPRLARMNEEALPVGAVVTVEPGVYRPGWGGVRIEDDVWLGADGPRILTDFRRDLLELV
ncbi:MAG TPA: Xaa-Pro peptidase family protein [Gemmatimonadaceae bacterium]